MTPDKPLTNRLEDDDYPAYTMGRAAEMLGTTPGFLRAIGEARL
ncbi:MerR family transcriptional regulator, partial [Streptomyces sp. NPDC005483]